MTNFEKIKAMDVEDLANVIYKANDEICFNNCISDTGNKFSCKFGENVDERNCQECMKNWLESEADDNA